MYANQIVAYSKFFCFIPYDISIFEKQTHWSGTPHLMGGFARTPRTIPPRATGLDGRRGVGGKLWQVRANVICELLTWPVDWELPCVIGQKFNMPSDRHVPQPTVNTSIGLLSLFWPVRRRHSHNSHTGNASWLESGEITDSLKFVKFDWITRIQRIYNRTLMGFEIARIRTIQSISTDLTNVLSNLFWGSSVNSPGSSDSSELELSLHITLLTGDSS